MPPCFDFYVWVDPHDRAAMLSRFVTGYVDGANPGDPRYEAFLRTYVSESPLPGDAEAMAELRRDADADAAFSLYLRARDFHEAIVTLTEEGAVVLGLGIDDPLNEPGIEAQASDALAALMKGLGAKAGIGGVELAPPQSAEEWADDGLVLIRVGTI